MKDRGGMRRLTSLMLFFLVSKATVYGRLNVNVALNRPTFMISTWNDPLFGGDFPASRAVDGNKDPIAMKVGNSCAVTHPVNNPWWAVDLGVALAVVGVLFSNRAETFGFLSNDFIVGLTDVSPAITAPTLLNYDLCAQYPGVVGEGATVNLTCTSRVPPRRYLIVQIENSNLQQLNFCEIEVYVGRWIWRPSHGRRMANKVASTFQVDRRVQCMANCTFSPVCDSYNYRAADKTCQFNTHDTPLIANSADIVADSAWDWFSSSFTVLV